MSDRLDELIDRLAAGPTDRSLHRLEADVGRGIRRRRSEARATTLLASVRIASVGIALAMGITTGGVTAAAVLAGPRASGIFSGAANLAPSTLLEGRR
jgi:hypothetical protein